MKVILHIGAQKTGSTALQQSLRRSERQLAAHGIAYPRNPMHENKQQIIIAGLGALGRRGRRRFPDTSRHSAMRRAWYADLRRTLSEDPVDILLLSTESLFRVYVPERLRTLRDDILSLGADEIRVVGYARRPSSRYLSGLQQGLKASHRLKEPVPTPYRQILEPYTEVFGREAVVIRSHDRTRLHGGDIVTDFVTEFLSGTGLSRDELSPPWTSNRSLGAEAMVVLRRYREDFHAENDDVFTDDTRQLIAALREAEARIGADRPRLKPMIADLLDYATDDALWLRDTFGTAFDGYDYDRIARGDRVPLPEDRLPRRLSDLIDIDPDRLRALIERLLLSGWTAGHLRLPVPLARAAGLLPGRRRRWLEGLLRDPPA